ncbi:MAG: hypothetical protein KKA42_16725 [candidate division Zixibacteria bacterium]|nr:hypothetical protein [candidate division Zixibacteria bacterium]
MYKVLSIVGLLLVVALFGTACSDDDDVCPLCPVEQQVMVYGSVRIANGAPAFWAILRTTDATIPDVDSVLVNGQQCVLEDHYYDLEPMALHARIEETTVRTAAGGLALDSVEIEFYAPDGWASCYVTALDDDLDTAVIVEPLPVSPWDTVAINDPIAVTWNSVDAAEWYMISYYYDFDSSGTIVWGRSRYIASGTDTTYTIPGSMTGFNGRYHIRILTLTGPQPEQEGNIEGTVFGGQIISSVHGPEISVIVGTGFGSSLPSVGQASRRDQFPESDLIYSLFK